MTKLRHFQQAALWGCLCIAPWSISALQAQSETEVQVSVETPAPPQNTLSIFQYSRIKEPSWYFGMSLGGGFYGTTPHAAPDDKLIDIYVLEWRAGAVISPQWLVGGEIRVTGHEYTAEGEGILAFIHSDVVTSYFPILEQGLYVKGGIGLAALMYVESVQAADGVSQTSKLTAEPLVDFKMGIGYEIQLGEIFNLGAECSYLLSLTSPALSDIVNEDAQVHFFSTMLTLNWY